MKKVSLKPKSSLLKPNNKIKVQKEIYPRMSQKASKLERTPAVECFDYSNEEKGYITRKDRNGNIIGIVRTIFPR